MVRNAASFILRNGPVTQQDRWEEDAGYSPFTLAAEISALLAAADIAELSGHSDAASTLRDTADAWNDNIERWIYATGGDLAQQLGVEGYYVRIAPPDTDGAASPTQGFVPIKNRPPGDKCASARFTSSAPTRWRWCASACARPTIPAFSTRVRVIDALLQRATAAGPLLVSLQRRRLRRTQGWFRLRRHRHRPSLAAAGRRARPLRTGRRTPQRGGSVADSDGKLDHRHSRLLPEQVWDAADIPALELFRGKPTGSACPLVWAHSEYIKLRRSLRDGKIFDQPPQTVQRYLVEKPTRQVFGWRFNNKPRSLPRNKTLRIMLLNPALVHWSIDGWKTCAGHQHARHRPGHVHPRLADSLAACRQPGRVYVLLAAGESLGRQGLHRHGGVDLGGPDYQG